MTTKLELAKRSAQDFRDLAEAIPQLVWTARPDGTLEFFNRRWVAYTGVSLEQARAQGLASAIHPTDVPQFQARLEQSRQSGEPFEAEIRLRRHDDRYCWFLARAAPRRSRGGQVSGWFGTATDIHEQKEAEIRSGFLAAASETLAASLDYEDTLRKIVALAVPRFADWAAMDMLDSAGAIRRVAMTHVDPEKEHLGWEISRRLPARLDDDAGVARVLRTGEPEFWPEVSEALLRQAVGDAQTREMLWAMHLRSAITAPMTVRGRTIGAIAFVRAEGDRRYDTQDLATALELARRAALAVENARLYRDSEAANQAKDEFLAVVSHELRTPLTAVLGYTGMLRAGSLPEERRQKALAVIERNVRAQARLIDDLLDVSRIVSGKLRLHLRSVEPVRVVEAALETVRPGAQAKGVRLGVDLDPAAGPIAADPDRLQQAVWNLLTNAIKFTPRGGAVSVSLRRDADEVVIGVRDTGQGIDPAFLPYVFDRFRQADASATRSHGGLGLGLAVVRHVVELHGGQVEADSDGLGKGACFRLRLPVHPGAAPAEEGRGPDEPRALAGRKLLVVDDDGDTREMLGTLFARAGADPAGAESAAEARVRLGAEWFDLLVCDVGLPGEDGYSLLRWLRSQPESAGGRTPALALTAYAGDEDRAEALAAGFDAHLAKPVAPEQVLATAVRLVEG